MPPATAPGRKETSRACEIQEAKKLFLFIKLLWNKKTGTENDRISSAATVNYNSSDRRNAALLISVLRV